VDDRPRNPDQTMETSSTFDLNASLSLWLTRFAQSPHVRNDNVAEMESHVRDSVAKLHSHGLSEEEAFLVAIRRVGSAARLEPEYAKINRDWKNWIAHGLILIFFSVVCWFVWGTLQLPRMMMAATAKAAGGAVVLPAFTQIMAAIGHYMFIPPLLALAYCIYVSFRKSGAKNSWIAFFAVTTAALIFIALPTLIAVLLPLIDFVNRLPVRIFSQH
jgi:hypothetical protein